MSMLYFSSEDVQKGDDIKISRQFKETVIRPILKVRTHTHTHTQINPTLFWCTDKGGSRCLLF